MATEAGESSASVRALADVRVPYDQSEPLSGSAGPVLSRRAPGRETLGSRLLAIAQWGCEMTTTEELFEDNLSVRVTWDGPLITLSAYGELDMASSGLLVEQLRIAEDCDAEQIVLDRASSSSSTQQD